MTGFYRITERRLVSVMAGYIGSGVACDECREVSMNAKFTHTVRTDEYQASSKKRKSQGVLFA